MQDIRGQASANLPSALYTAEGVRSLDQVAIAEFGIPGITLMRRAAEACVDTLVRFWPIGPVTVFCGHGNNAGDGYIIAGLLAGRGREVRVRVVGDPALLAGDARAAREFCLSSSATLRDFQADEPATGAVLVDALLGTGITGEVRPAYRAAIDYINAAGIPVLSVDVPSGLCSNTGRILGAAVSASVTVTFIGLKRGLFTLDGPDAAGEIVFDALSVPAAVYERVPDYTTRLELAPALASLPPRRRHAHKHQFGHVLVVGGDEGMGGAAAMSAEAALRCGAGLVSVATHPAHTVALLARRPELMVRGIAKPSDLVPMIDRASVIVVGPGLGRRTWSETMFACVLAETRVSSQKLVIDADGLHLLAGRPERRDSWVLTPHPGEAGQLLPGDPVQADRFSAATRLQATYGGAVLLKGRGTLIADGRNLSLCPFGNPGMSSAGMGDILSGVIGALLAQGQDPGNAARLGAVVHALAGDACAAAGGERGIVATDLLRPIRRLLNPVAVQHAV